MKLLFVCFEYWGAKDPCSRCIQHLRTELLNQDVQSDVLTYDWTGDAPQETKDETGAIYTAKTWYRHARLTRNHAGQVKMSPMQWIKAAASRGFAMITEGKSYTQKGIPIGATKVLQKRLTKLCLANSYDWVISVSYPFANHIAVLNACPPKCKVALYNLDPYWNNQTYDPNKRSSRAKEEAAAYKRADHIFCTPEQLQDYQNDIFAEVRQKITPLNYPNFVQPCIDCISDIRFDPEQINLLYLGTIYGDIRKPDALFRMFEQALPSEPRLHLYVIGKKFGKDADHYLVEYQKELGKHLTVCDPVPVEETADLMWQADVLVNLGNTMHNQMPSKLVEYMATGKPILNVSAVKDCNTLPLMERYPLSFQIFGDGVPHGNEITCLTKFCQHAKENALLQTQLQQLYPELIVTAIVGHFLNKLECEAME